MRKYKKLIPWVLLGVAVAGLLLQYMEYKKEHEECGCGKSERKAALV